MTDPTTEALRDFRADVPGPDMTTMSRCYRRAVGAERSPSGRSARLSGLKRRPRVLAAVLAAILGVTGGASALAIRYLGPSPGLRAGFSSFDSLPPAALPAFLSRQDLERHAAYIGVPTTEVQERLRLLQSGLPLGPGRTHGEGKLYGLIGENGTACLFLAGQIGTCVDEANAPHAPGVLTAVAAGYPGQTPAVVGIVADNVTNISLQRNGERRPVAIVNNSFYAELADMSAGERAVLHMQYADGTTRVRVIRTLGS
jgi:hypothetical protein